MDKALKFLKNEIAHDPYSFLAMVLSMAGAYFTSDPSSFLRSIGFGIWFISNLLIGYGFYKNKNWFMVATFAFYEIMNLRGIYSNWG